jgi:glycopeptide antibiotics resistance protein
MKRIDPKSLFLKIIFIIYIIILFKLTVFRNGFGFDNLFENGKLNLIPFADLIGIITRQGFGQFIYLFLGNIIWFIPFGFLLPLICKRKFTLTQILLLGFALSLSIEILQYVFGTGVSEIDDLILNTLGTVVGYGLQKKIIGIYLPYKSCKK